MTADRGIEGRFKRDSSAYIGNTEIVAVQGDITQQEVDVIVNSANTWMSLGGTRSVAGAIIRKTNKKVVDELAKIKKPVNLGDVIVTPGFDLPCRYIFHVATHGTASEERTISYDDLTVRLLAISNGISNVIKKTTELKINSLAMPLLATGSLGYSSRIVIECILNTLQENLQKGTTLEEVRIVVLRDHETLWQLKQGLRSKFDYLLPRKKLWNYALEKASPLYSETTPGYVSNDLDLTERPTISADRPDLKWIRNGSDRVKALEAEYSICRNRCVL